MCNIKHNVQNIGWQGNTLDGKTAGTEGRALRIEAINMNLINAPKMLELYTELMYKI